MPTPPSDRALAARPADAPAGPVGEGSGFQLARHLDAPPCDDFSVASLTPDGRRGHVGTIDRHEGGARGWVSTADTFDHADVLFAGRSTPTSVDRPSRTVALHGKGKLGAPEMRGREAARSSTDD